MTPFEEVKAMHAEFVRCCEEYGVIGISRTSVQVYTEEEFLRLAAPHAAIRREYDADWNETTWTAIADGLTITYREDGNHATEP